MRQGAMVILSSIALTSFTTNMSVYPGTMAVCSLVTFVIGNDHLALDRVSTCGDLVRGLIMLPARSRGSSSTASTAFGPFLVLMPIEGLFQVPELNPMARMAYPPTCSETLDSRMMAPVPKRTAKASRHLALTMMLRPSPVMMWIPSRFSADDPQSRRDSRELGTILSMDRLGTNPGFQFRIRRGFGVGEHGCYGNTGPPPVEAYRFPMGNSEPAPVLTPIPAESLSVEIQPLHQPDLKKLASVLENGLKQTFEEASVSVQTCPDLTQAPFNLAAPGLCGQAKILDVGGCPYLFPLAQREKFYDIKDFPKLVQAAEDKPQLMIGAGAAPWTFLSRNAEVSDIWGCSLSFEQMMTNILIDPQGQVLKQNTKIARTFDDNNEYEVINLPETEHKMSILSNLLMSEGRPGPVLAIKCKKRIGPDNFVTALRKVLVENYPKDSIGLGGTFVVQTGKVKVHIMPELSSCPLTTDAQVENWLKFFEINAPFTCLSVLVSNDPVRSVWYDAESGDLTKHHLIQGLDLRVEHSHGFNDRGDGGHYHYDTTPDETEYLAYYSVAQHVCRIDRPVESHQIGRD
eukprot:TCALIF_01198-PA protein Name:"Similar to Ester hydrolase C11orf54 homolog (Mus musculus)" AED:0.32 eAED:0.36 QI:0/0/0/0.37/1/1/8/0/572